MAAAEALFPMLTPFHEVSGLALETVEEIWEDGSLVRISLSFVSKTLHITADADDDTVDLTVETIPGLECRQTRNPDCSTPWNDFLHQEFGWGSVTINQNGYIDGLLLSFDGIIPQLIVNVFASSLKVSRIGRWYASQVGER